MYQSETKSGEPVEISFKDNYTLFNGHPLNWKISNDGKDKYIIHKDHKTFKCHVLSVDALTKTVEIKINKHVYHVQLKDKMDVLLEKMGIDMSAVTAVNDLKAPMPGLVLDVLVENGQEVQKGDQLVILEAMKMENVLKAEGDGTIQSVEVKKGDSVEKNHILIKF